MLMFVKILFNLIRPHGLLLLLKIVSPLILPSVFLFSFYFFLGGGINLQNNRECGIKVRSCMLTLQNLLMQTTVLMRHFPNRQANSNRIKLNFYDVSKNVISVWCCLETNMLCIDRLCLHFQISGDTMVIRLA